MTLSETMAFIHAASWLGSRPGLERMAALMDLLGHPERDVPFIHVAGTNGKGSTAAMLASIFQTAGYRTGLFTSPHLLRYHERIQINGLEISDADLCAAAETVRAAVEQMADTPTEFERFTAMALVHFSQSRCDVVVLEVGMGGRLDATNIIPAPEAAVIASIGLDHTEYLGHTLAAIAGEKAGIVKPGTRVILAGQPREAEDAVRLACRNCGCPLTVTVPALRRSGDLSGQTLDYRDRRDLHLGLLGIYQCQNAALALDTIEVLRAGGWTISEEAIRQGLASARWPGRFEVLRRDPLVLADGAHNPQGAAALAQCLNAYLPGRKLTFVMGVMADKDYPAMLDAVAPFAGGFVTVTPDSPRSLPARELAEVIRRRLALPVRDAESIREGLTLALADCGPEDAVCAFGSLYQTGEVRSFFDL